MGRGCRLVTYQDIPPNIHRIQAAARKLRGKGGSLSKGSKFMNWNQIEGRWEQLAGQVKSQWGKLTDDDLKNIAGKRQQLVGKLHERYGIIKGDIEKEINHWLRTVEPDHSVEPTPPTKR